MNDPAVERELRILRKMNGGRSRREAERLVDFEIEEEENQASWVFRVVEVLGKVQRELTTQ
jgi:hypothetical protein